MSLPAIPDCYGAYHFSTRQIHGCAVCPHYEDCLVDTDIADAWKRPPQRPIRLRVVAFALFTVAAVLYGIVQLVRAWT